MHFLPYGTVVTLKEIDYPVMITDWTAQVPEQDSEKVKFLKKLVFNSTLRAIDNATRKHTMYDYFGCPWPRGYILDKDRPWDRNIALRTIPFNHKDIESVLFIGPFAEIFAEHDKKSFEYACEHDMEIAKFYSEQNVSEIKIQKPVAPKEKGYKLPESTIENDEKVYLPLGSVVSANFAEDDEEPRIGHLMIMGFKPPFYKTSYDYEVFEWESGSIVTDQDCLSIKNKDIVGVVSLGYVDADVQAMLRGEIDEEFRFPLLEELFV